MTTRFEHYEELKQCARDLRLKFGLASPRVLRSDLRRIYKETGIERVDLWPPPGARGRVLRVLKGAYFNDEIGPTVLLPRHLPPEPRIFSMAHELKHHLVDRESVGFCATANQDEAREIGAEIFAAELIFPEDDFRREMLARGCRKGGCTPELLVRLKRETRSTLSYAALVKRAEWCEFAGTGSLKRTPWQRLEAEIYGPPPYARRTSRAPKSR